MTYRLGVKDMSYNASRNVPFKDFTEQSQQAAQNQGQQYRYSEKGYETVTSSLIKNYAAGSSDNYLRFIFWGGAAAPSDNISFFRGAKLIASDYGTDGKILFVPLSSAHNLVQSINNQNDYVIQSLDIVCHGDFEKLLFSYYNKGVSSFCSPTQMIYNLKDDKNIETVPGLSAEDIKIGKKAYHKYKKYKIRNGLHMYDDNRFPNSINLNSIDFKKFRNQCKIEFHGCNSGSISNDRSFKNFAKVFSKKLHEATKKDKNKTIVIGHGTSNCANEITCDYRENFRRGYHNGTPLLETKKPGRITKSTIDKLFKYYDDDKLNGNHLYISKLGVEKIRSNDD